MNTLKMTALVILAALSITSAFSQAEYAYNSSLPEIVEGKNSSKMMSPSFKGGSEALAEFMSANLEYPELAKRQGVEGTVILAYTITRNGEIKDIKVAQSVNKELDNEAIRLAKKMPNWTPAVQDGQARAIKYQLPVKFVLTN